MKYQIKYLYLYALSPLSHELRCFKNPYNTYEGFDIHILLYGKTIDRIFLTYVKWGTI